MDLTGSEKNADFRSPNLSLIPLQSKAPASTYPKEVGRLPVFAYNMISERKTITKSREEGYQ